MRWKYTLIGIALDVADLLVLFTIYGVPVLSLASTAFWFLKLGPIGIANGVQAIPGVSALPINTAMGFIADKRGTKEGLL